MGICVAAAVAASRFPHAPAQKTAPGLVNRKYRKPKLGDLPPFTTQKNLRCRKPAHMVRWYIGSRSGTCKALEFWKDSLVCPCSSAAVLLMCVNFKASLPVYAAA